MIFGSLFTGIGGIDLGLERAGMRCAWQVEIDSFCRRVLDRHWPDVTRHDNIRTFDPVAGGEPVDLVAGGFPCQPVSCAGKRRGEADPRWMWPEFLRVVRACRPAWVLAENVLGLRTRGADRVLGDLEAEGYSVAPIVVGARHVGAPHRRDRVWIVAHADESELFERLQPGRRLGARGADPTWPRHDGSRPAVADADGRRCEVERLAEHAGQQSAPRAEPDGLGAAGCGSRSPMGDAATSGAGWWDAEPDVGRVAHGVPARVDRLRALGNAVVPQVVEEIGRAIINVNEY